MDIPAIPGASIAQDLHREQHLELQNKDLFDDAQSLKSQRVEPHHPPSSYHARLSLSGAYSALTSGAVSVNDDNDLSSLPQRAWRQLLGLNPFKTSYFSLYRPIDDWNSRAILVAAIACAVAAGIPLPIIGVIFSHIINSFPPPEHELNISIAQLLGVAVGYFIVTWGWSVCWGIVGERVSRRFREALVRKVVGMDMTFYDVEDLDITGTLTGSTQMIQLGTSEKVGLFIQSVSYFVAAFVVGFILSAKLTAVLFVAVIPTMIIFVVTGTTVVSISSRHATQLSEKAATIAEGAIGSVQVVQAFGAGYILSDDHYRILAQALRKGMKKSIAGAIMLGLVYFTCYAANSLAFYYGSRLATHGAGTIYAVVFLILDASFVVGQFGPFIQTFAQAAAAGSKVLDVLDHADPQINVYSEDGISADGTSFDEDIVLRDVSFRYPARVTTRVVHDFSLRIKAHTTTGIVGLSGSGKSTIVGLLLRFYNPFSGHIYLREHELNAFNVRSLRAQISLVDQDPVLFTGTILDNIRYGIVDAGDLTEEEVLERCKHAAIEANADFISTLPQGIHTKVGMSGGTSLSGGQRQRICLARAIVRRPKLMILDEPTSALDTTSEALILESLKKVSTSGCTVILIAHRLATVKEADNIVVMGQGKILDQGTHEQLLGHDGLYKKLVEAQGMRDTEQLERNQPSQTSLSSDSTIDFEKDGSTVEDETEHQSQPMMLPLKTLLSRCFLLSKPERPLVIIGLLGSTVSGALVIGEAIIFGHLVNILNTQENNPVKLRDQADFFCLMFFTVSLIALFAYSVSGSMFGMVSEALTLRVRDVSLRTILKQDLAWFSTPGHSPHELMASINMDAGHLSGLSGVIIGTIFSVTTSVIGGIVLAHCVAWKIAIVLLAAVPVMILAGFLRLRVLAKSEARHETAYNAAAAYASEACQNIRTVAALGREAEILREYRSAVQKPYRESFRFNVVSNFTLAFSLAITYFVYALAYWWGSQQVRMGAYSQQDFFIVLPALLFSAQASGQMFSLAPEVTRARSAANSVLKLHDEQPTLLKEQDSSPRGGFLGQMPSAHQAEIPIDRYRHALPNEEMTERDRTGQAELRDVTYSYPSRPDDLVLENVSMEIKPGQLIGIVGPSGAGKSSLISLLERFYDVDSGVVKVDGIDIRNQKASVHRDKMSLVSQEPDLFSGSISFNIRLGAKGGQTVTQDEIEEVCEQCGIHDFIMGLPEGYMTDCGFNGSKLSGGQKQRVAIARALIRNPDLLLLDEATASLDSQSEKQVHKATMAAAQNRTTIIVAHRLSTVQNADKIFVFDKGRVTEQGRHEELIAERGIYASMVQAQTLMS